MPARSLISVQFPTGVALALTLLVGAGCETPLAAPLAEPPPTEAHALAATPHAEVAQDPLLRAVRTATARYHSPQVAEADGFVPNDHCAEIPGVAGMGYHWNHPGRMDGVFDPLEPEVVIYAPGPQGQLELVAVEYVVLDQGQERPHFGDHPFDIGGTPNPNPHWSLHVWLYAENPDGIFEPWNPRITCG
jgi:hypothetical protein